jgi:hypothetical protein
MITILLTLFVFVLVPVYWRKYGAQNFLWLSDIGLFITVAALWLHSKVLMSIALVIIFPLEVLWNIDFFIRLASGWSPLGLASYMFNQRYDIFLRLLSLFHVGMPIVWVWYGFSWGYAPHAFWYGLCIWWIIIIISCCCTDPQKNINWVFHPMKHKWHTISQREWIVILLFGPCMVWIPWHLLLRIWLR